MPCAGKTLDGRACGGIPATGASWCWAHDPDAVVSSRRQQSRIAGGQARGQQLRRRAAPVVDPKEAPPWWRLESVADLRDAYRNVTRALLSDGLDPRTANAVVAALGGLVKLVPPGELLQPDGPIREFTEAEIAEMNEGRLPAGVTARDIALALLHDPTTVGWTDR